MAKRRKDNLLPFALLGAGTAGLAFSSGKLTGTQPPPGGGGTAPPPDAPHEIANLQVQYELSSFAISALNPGQLPIKVYPGDGLNVTATSYRYKGPGGTLFVCWGLKLGTGNFNDGNNLQGGPQYFASKSLLVTASDVLSQTIVTSLPGSPLPIMSSFVPPSLYDTYVWVATSSSSFEGYFIKRYNASEGLIDTDFGVLQVLVPSDVFFEVQPGRGEPISAFYSIV